MTTTYGRAEFEALIEVGSGDAQALAEYRYRIDDRGVYYLGIENPAQLAIAEIFELGSAHADALLSDAVLPFPFTLAQLIEFDTSSVTGDVVSGRWWEYVGGVRRTDEIPNAAARALANQLLDALEVARDRATSPRKVPRQRAQEEAILSALRSLGHEPAQLEANREGRPGAKAEVRQRLASERPDLFPRHGTTFDKAWERLRARKEIADMDEGDPGQPSPMNPPPNS